MDIRPIVEYGTCEDLGIDPRDPVLTHAVVWHLRMSTSPGNYTDTPQEVVICCRNQEEAMICARMFSDGMRAQAQLISPAYGYRKAD